MKAKILKSIDGLLKDETNPKEVWKILDKAGLINGDCYEFDKNVHTDRETIVELLFVTYMVNEEDDLFNEGGHGAFLKTHGQHLNVKYSEIRKAISMKSLQTTLDCSCSPSYLQGTHSLAPLQSALALTLALAATLTLTFTNQAQPGPHPGHR